MLSRYPAEQPIINLSNNKQIKNKRINPIILQISISSIRRHLPDNEIPSTVLHIHCLPRSCDQRKSEYHIKLIL